MNMKFSRDVKLFFTSDHHFGHANIVKFCDRPYSSTHEMNSDLVNRWNEKVPQDGIVVVAGDLAFGDPARFIKRLNGEIILVSGDHDKSSLRNPQLFHTICDLLRISIKPDLHIVVCHWCMRYWPRSHFNSFHLYGHSHGRSEPVGKSWDVGVDANDFAPLSLNEVLKIMRTRPDNVNYIGNKNGRSESDRRSD